MPLTFPSHAAAVLPIKFAAPHRWDGVALVIGSTAPDLPYAAEPYLRFDAHNWAAVLWFCLPITLLGGWLVRWGAPTIAAHLPNLGGFALRDYAVLGSVRHRWYVTVASAIVGTLTHLVWDSFTHPAAQHTWTFLPLAKTAFAGQPWWHVLQLTSTVLGALVTTVFAWRLGRQHLLVAWHGMPPTIAPRVYRPDAAAFRPGTAVFRPDAPAFRPDAAAFRPDAAAFRPDAAAFRPDAAAFRPDAAVFRPDASGVSMGVGQFGGLTYRSMTASVAAVFRSAAVVFRSDAAVFWFVTVAIGIAGLAALPMLADSRLSNVLGVRLLMIGATALLGGTLATRPCRRPERIARNTPQPNAGRRRRRLS